MTRALFAQFSVPCTQDAGICSTFSYMSATGTVKSSVFFDFAASKVDQPQRLVFAVFLRPKFKGNTVVLGSRMVGTLRSWQLVHMCGVWGDVNVSWTGWFYSMDAGTRRNSFGSLIILRASNAHRAGYWDGVLLCLGGHYPNFFGLQQETFLANKFDIR